MEEEKEIFGRMALGLTAMYGVYRVFQFAIRRQMAEPSLGLQMLLAFVLYGVGFFLLLRIAGPKAVKGRVQAARMRPDAFVRILLLQMFSMVIHLLLIQFETLVLHSTSPAPLISFDNPWSFFMLLFLTPRSSATGTEEFLCIGFGAAVWPGTLADGRLENGHRHLLPRFDLGKCVRTNP